MDEKFIFLFVFALQLILVFFIMHLKSLLLVSRLMMLNKRHYTALIPILFGISPLEMPRTLLNLAFSGWPSKALIQHSYRLRLFQPLYVAVFEHFCLNQYFLAPYSVVSDRVLVRPAVSTPLPTWISGTKWRQFNAIHTTAYSRTF